MNIISNITVNCAHVFLVCLIIWWLPVGRYESNKANLFQIANIIAVIVQ